MEGVSDIPEPVQRKRTLLPGIIIGVVVVALVVAVLLKASLLNEGEQLSEEEVEAILQEGLNSYNAGDYASAEETFRSVIEADPENAAGYYFLGWALLDQGRTAEAEAMFVKAAELDPSADQTFLSLGQLYLQQERLTEAEEAFLTAKSMNPSSPNTHFALARVYQLQGEAEKARSSIEAGLALSTEEQTGFILSQIPELESLVESGSRACGSDDDCAIVATLDSQNPCCGTCGEEAISKQAEKEREKRQAEDCEGAECPMHDCYNEKLPRPRCRSHRCEIEWVERPLLS